MRVLVVEDERALADAIARGLRREGMAVDVAYDGDTGNPHGVFLVTRRPKRRTNSWTRARSSSTSSRAFVAPCSFRGVTWTRMTCCSCERNYIQARGLPTLRVAARPRSSTPVRTGRLLQCA